MTLQCVTIIDVDELHTHTAVPWWEVERILLIVFALIAAFIAAVVLLFIAAEYVVPDSGAGEVLAVICLALVGAGAINVLYQAYTGKTSLRYRQHHISSNTTSVGQSFFCAPSRTIGRVSRWRYGQRPPRRHLKVSECCSRTGSPIGCRGQDHL